MPRKATATAVGLLALFVERASFEGDALWGVVATLGLYLLCHTATDIAGMIWGKGAAKDE